MVLNQPAPRSVARRRHGPRAHAYGTLQRPAAGGRASPMRHWEEIFPYIRVEFFCLGIVSLACSLVLIALYRWRHTRHPRGIPAPSAAQSSPPTTASAPRPPAHRSAGRCRAYAARRAG